MSCVCHSYTDGMSPRLHAAARRHLLFFFGTLHEIVKAKDQILSSLHTRPNRDERA
jgi:hypothetical protein